MPRTPGLSAAAAQETLSPEGEPIFNRRNKNNYISSAFVSALTNMC